MSNDIVHVGGATRYEEHESEIFWDFVRKEQSYVGLEVKYST